MLQREAVVITIFVVVVIIGTETEEQVLSTMNCHPYSWL